MSVLSEEARRTYSVCPVCLKRIPAARERREDGIYLVKTCPEHGTFSSVIWRNRMDFDGWRGKRPAVGEGENVNCPTGCGLCPDHLRGTCCTLLEITSRCNMNCTFCFAEPDGTPDPTTEEVKGWIRDLTDPRKTLLQLSGGEPTVREDLPELVAYAKEVGCKYVQLNSNGLRLAEEEAFVRRLADAGLSFVFMQFDGVDDQVYETLRRRPMLEIKKKAIENCGKYGIGVTLVPVIVPGVNTNQIGDIIRFAAERSPYVRGVHFQPVSYFGRIPHLPADADRFTLDELMDEVVKQAGDLLSLENLAPSCCDHPMCGFHGDFIVMPDHTLYPLTRYTGTEDETGASSDGDCCCGSPADAAARAGIQDPAEKNREFVGRRWERRAEDVVREANGGGCCCGSDEAVETAPESAESCCCGCGCGSDEAMETAPEAAESCCCCCGCDEVVEAAPESAESCCGCGCDEVAEAAQEAAESCCCGSDGVAETAPGSAESCCCCCGGDETVTESVLEEETSCCCDCGQEISPEESDCCCGSRNGNVIEELDLSDMETFLRRARSHGFTITSMAFQDAGNLDIERLRQCSLHVYRDGKHIPFCACYLSPMEEVQ